MGYDTRKMIVEGLVNRKDGAMDKVHDDLWELAVARVQEALDDKIFEPIRLHVIA